MCRDITSGTCWVCIVGNDAQLHACHAGRLRHQTSHGSQLTILNEKEAAEAASSSDFEGVLDQLSPLI